MAKICLDAGHGGKDPGATGCGRKEKDDVLKLTKRVGAILTGRNHSIVYTRTKDVYESPSTKAKEGNASGAAFFASFHRNSAKPEAAGHETLVYANTGKAKLCADAANKNMSALGFKNRGTKIRTELAVLRGTTMPAALFETGFITNAGDNKLFDSKFEQIAQGYADAIEVAVGKGSGSSSSGSSTSSGNKTTSNTPSYKIGNTYTLQSNMVVRTGAGTNYRAKKHSELTADGRKHDKDKNGCLDKGTRITCQQVKKSGSNIWIKCPSGWIAAYYNKKTYVK